MAYFIHLKFVKKFKVNQFFVEECCKERGISKLGYMPYKWIYWRVEYLAICLKNSVGVILI